MKGDDGLYLGHMLDAARKAHGKVAAITRAQFDADENEDVVWKTARSELPPLIAALAGAS